MKNITVMFVAICLMTSTAFAQHRGHKGHGKMSAEAKAELKAYNEANVNPVMQQAYNQLVAGLSAEDAAFLTQKRAEKEKMRAASQDARKTFRDANKNTDKEVLKAKREEQRKADKAKRKAFNESMQPFIERNKALIDKSMVAVNAKKEEWKTAKRQIIEKYMTEEQKAERAKHKEAHDAKKGDKKGKGKGKRGAGKKGEGKGDKKAQGATKLLFWSAK